MLRAFFQVCAKDNTRYFQDLIVWQSQEARAHFQRHPVIFLSFKDCKGKSWTYNRSLIAHVFQEAYQEHYYLLSGNILSPEEKRFFRSVLGGKLSADRLELATKILSQQLERHHGQKVIILVDEYDTPIHSAVESGYYDEAIPFFRGLFSAALKDNESLFKAVLTGILRVSKEGLFSSLNHIGVHTVFSDGFQTEFGFTEPEVIALLEEYGNADQLPSVQRMYNGYRIGRQQLVEIYNPWSVISFLMTEGHPLDPYWMNTGSTTLLDQLILKHGDALRTDLEKLLRQEPIHSRYEDTLTFADIEKNPAALFTFLLHSGYLKVAGSDATQSPPLLTLEVPNREVRLAYRSLARDWLEVGLGNRAERVSAFTQALLSGDASRVQADLTEILLKQCSFMDGVRPAPEKFYHGLVLGLLVALEPRYVVRSNTEAGYGQVDVQIWPASPGLPGVVLELKVVRRPSSGETESLDEALLAALDQILEKRYLAGLEAEGVRTIHAYGLAFDGKRVQFALLSQREEVAARVHTARTARALEPAGGRKEGAESPVPRLAMSERLALEEAVLPRLTAVMLKRLWLKLGFDLTALAPETLGVQWDQLLTRCVLDGQLSELLLALEHAFPALKTDAVVQRVKGMAE